MTKNEFNEYISKQIDTNTVSHSYLFSAENLKTFNETLLLFLINLVTKPIRKNLQKMEISEEEIEKEVQKIVSLINAETLDEIQRIDGKVSKVNDIRNLFSKVYEKPFFITKKIYIIENAEYLNNSSQNAMLKILEEPPEYVHILLITNTMNNILDTIKSRCQKIYIAETLEENKRENSNSSSNSNFNKINQNDFLNQIILIFEKQKAKQELEIEEKEKIFSYSMIEDVQKYPKSIYYAKYSKNMTKENIFRYLNNLEQVIYLKICQKINMLIYSEMYKIIVETRRRITSNYNFEMSKDNLIFSIWDISHNRIHKEGNYYEARRN